MPTSPLFWVLVFIGVVGLAAAAWWLLRGYKRGGWGPTKVKVKTGFAEAEFEPGQGEKQDEPPQTPGRAQTMTATGKGSRIAQASQRQKGTGGTQTMTATGKGVIEDAKQTIQD